MSNTTIPLPVLAVVAFAATRFHVPSNPTPSTPPGDPRFDAHLEVVDRGDTGIVVTVLLVIRPVMSATGSSTVPRLFVASGLFVLLRQSGRWDHPAFRIPFRVGLIACAAGGLPGPRDSPLGVGCFLVYSAGLVTAKRRLRPARRGDYGADGGGAHGGHRHHRSRALAAREDRLAEVG